MRLPAEVRERTVPSMLDRTAAERRSHPALIAPGLGSEERTLDYGELRTLSARLATTLREAGVERGDRVAILLDPEHTLEAHLTYHASHLLGAINVPLNTRYVRRELEFAIGFVDPAAIVSSARFGPMIDDMDEPARAAASIVTGDGEREGSFAAALEADALEDPVAVGEDDDADWIFTSGTTGNPKAVAISHGASVACGHQALRLWGLGPDSVYQSFSPFFTSTGCHTNLLPSVLAGCTYAIEAAFDVRETLRRAIRLRTTSIFLISGAMQLVLDRIPQEELDEMLEASSLERIAYGGQPMAGPFYPRALEAFEDRHGIELAHLWGLTEGGTSGTFLDPALHREAVGRIGRHGLSIGRGGFSDWVDARVLGESGAPAQPGEIGELCLSAPSLMDRYVDEPDATAEALRDGWLHTGDMGTVDAAGFIYFVDRRKAMIRRGGLNVSSAEVEGVLTSHPAVAEAAAIPKPNPILEEEVKAVVVLREGSQLSAEELIDHCREQLADYKVPVEIEFRNELPKNAMGRVVKGALSDAGRR